jgi:hypothetical protein
MAADPTATASADVSNSFREMVFSGRLFRMLQQLTFLMIKPKTWGPSRVDWKGPKLILANGADELLRLALDRGANCANVLRVRQHNSTRGYGLRGVSGLVLGGLLSGGNNGIPSAETVH